MAILSRNPDESGEVFSTLLLPDGRRLSWSEWGIPDGPAVIYCHGFPSSRLEAALADGAARRTGIRLIAIDRPGMGHSDPAPHRTPLTTARDLGQLAEHLNLRQWAALGVSAGGPYALALAASHPHQTRAVACVGALAPSAGSQGMHPLARHVLQWARRHPHRLTTLIALLTPLLRRHPTWAVRWLAHRLPDPDARLLGDPTFLHHWAQALAEGLRQGRPVGQDLVALVRHWDIPLHDITCPVFLWHGEADNQVPSHHTHWLAERLPTARLKMVPREGHFSLPAGHAEAILGPLQGILTQTDAPPR